mgnify:FL=1
MGRQICGPDSFHSGFGLKFRELELAGVWLIEQEPKGDERGFFSRSFCEKEFEAHGLLNRFQQHSYSFNRVRGTLRGMHWQKEPGMETKVVTCVRGAVLDLVVDLRKDSKTYCKWAGV